MVQIASFQRLTPRIALFFIAVAVKIAALTFTSFVYAIEEPALAIPITAIWVVWFATLFMVAISPTDRLLLRQMGWLKTAAKTIIVTIIVAGLIEVSLLITIGVFSSQIKQSEGTIAELLTSLGRATVYSDATALNHQATENLLDGKNPYAEPNVISAAKEYDVPFNKLTPLRAGRFADDFPLPTMDEWEELWLSASENPDEVPIEFESKLSYPAGAFLLPAPFLLLGVNDIRIVFILFALPALALAIWWAPSGLRFYLVAALLTSLELWNAPFAGETGFLMFPFLLLAWILFKRKWWLSAICMAAAVAIKQIAWFFLPFYLILIFRELGIRKALSVSAIIGGVFLAANLPFILTDPQLWFSSIMAPMTDNLFPIGVGTITFVLSGALHVESSLPFAVMEIIVAILAMIWYFRNCRRFPHTGPILAVLPLFFAWRSGWSYFYYVDIIILAAILINEYSQKQTPTLIPNRPPLSHGL
ncbi:MAG: hypothetical protein V3W01_01090 [Dehalococcoidales bacterium]